MMKKLILGLLSALALLPGGMLRSGDVRAAETFAVQSYRGALRLLDKDNPYFLLKAGDGAVKEKTLTLKTLKKLLSDIKTLIVS